MKNRTKLVLGLVAAFGLGGAVVEGLHAQAKAKPPVYYVVEVDVTNVEAYTKEYAPKAQALIRKSGGRPLAAGQNVMTFEGQPPKPRVAVIAWDSFDAIKAWRSTAEYKESRKIGDKYAKFRAFAVEGMPQ